MSVRPSRAALACLAASLVASAGCATSRGGSGAAWSGVNLSGVPSRARDAADSIYVMLARETRLEPRRSRGEINTIYRYCPRPAARIELDWRIDSHPSPDPFAILDRELPRMGWTLDPNRADGPDGTVYAFLRGKLLCVIEGQWDGGLDDDSNPVIDPARSLLVDVGSAERCRGGNIGH